MAEKQHIPFASALGCALLGWVAGLWLAGWVALLLNGSVNGVLLLVGPAFAALLSACGQRHQTWARQAWVAFAATVITGSSCAAAAAFFDVSWDGQAYQQEAVLRLAGGWNPLRHGALDTNVRFDDVWINHYPKGLWLAQAVLLRAINHIEAVKGLSLVLVLASFLLAASALRTFGGTTARAAALGALAAANPVALTQVFSSYVDGALGALLLSAVSLLRLWWVQRDSMQLLVFAVCLALLANIKFTGLIYGIFIVVAVGAFCFALQRRIPRPLVASIVAGLGLATLVFGADPYMTNWRRHGHPFHPLMGSAAVDIITPHATPDFLALSRPHQLALASLAWANNHRKPPALKTPLAFSSKELRTFAHPDTRIGGFGPWFGAALILMLVSLTALAFSVRFRWRAALPVAAALAYTLFTVLANPACWWARYVPQLWLLPVGVLAVQVGRQQRMLRFALWAQGCLAFVLVGNVVLVGGAALRGQLNMTEIVRNHYRALREQARGNIVRVRWNGFESNRRRFSENGVVAEATEGPCGHAALVPFSRAEICMASSPPSPRPAGVRP